MSAQERAYRPADLFHLPDSIAAMLDAAEGIQGTDAGELSKVAAVKCGDARGKVFYAAERTAGAACGYELRRR